MNNPLIVINNLGKTYQAGSTEIRALNRVSMRIVSGQAVAVMGPSGSGKSTLLSIIGALNQPTEGHILIDGIDLYSLNQEQRADFRREYLGFVFQQFQLIPYLTSLENVMLPLTTTRFTAKEKRAMALNALERVSMQNRIDHLPSQLSGGEQERVAIARAIVNAPPLILADEPTGSLDTKTAAEIMDLFSSLNDNGMTIMMVTHNPENTSHMNRVITMQDGQIIDDTEILRDTQISDALEIESAGGY